MLFSVRPSSNWTPQTSTDIAPRSRRDTVCILLCLAHMAFGGIVDYYAGDCESAAWCVSREHMMCDELEHLETDWFKRKGNTFES